ncbi:MAG: MATE family efflux transporter [Dehalococcoidia bacterium]|nr:MATE family efflux transporter [Dehalococcoidia bacterium]
MADGSGPQSPRERGRADAADTAPTAVAPDGAPPLSGEDPDEEDSSLVATATLGGGGARGGRGGRGRQRLDLTTGSVPKKLFHQAWPQFAENILNVIDQMVDLVWAGLLPGGFRAIAGLGIGQSFVQVANFARQGLDQSLRAMIARAVGAGNIPLANHVAQQAFALNAVYAVIMALVGLLLTDVFISVIGASDAIRAETGLYMRIHFIGMATQSFRMMTGTSLQASGEPIAPLKAATATRLIHIALSPLLMFGPWWFPSMGLAGAALANVLAQLVGLSINLYALLNGSSRLHLTFKRFRMDYRVLWSMVRLGAPAAVTAAERSFAQLALLGMASPFGDVGLAAYALMRRLENFLNFGSRGIGQAAGVMVGQNLGAGKPGRAKAAILWGLVYVQMVPSLFRVTLFFFPFILITIFTREPGVVSIGSQLLQLQVIAAFFMGAQIVFQQSYNTAGDMVVPMVVTMLAVWCVEVPVAWFLTGTSVGILGIGYAAIAGMAVRNICYVPYFFWGRWLRVRVL